MVKISDDKWEQIKHYFNYLCDDKLLICPNCGMPYKEGYICESCGADNSEQEIDYGVEEWRFDDEVVNNMKNSTIGIVEFFNRFFYLILKLLTFK